MLVCIFKEYEEEKENEEETWFYIADKLNNMMIHVTRDDCKYQREILKSEYLHHKLKGTHIDTFDFMHFYEMEDIFKANPGPLTFPPKSNLFK